jgi:hypothetical protein
MKVLPSSFVSLDQCLANPTAYIYCVPGRGETEQAPGPNKWGSKSEYKSLDSPKTL